jgi:6-pyruvoyltetrahydropterin/6-carboxytetrahydropterin synthase
MLNALESTGHKKLYRLPANPTAENMALYLFHDIIPTLLAGTGVTLSKITLWETENCFVEVSR